MMLQAQAWLFFAILNSTPTTEAMIMHPTLHLQIFQDLRSEWPTSFFRMKEKKVVSLIRKSAITQLWALSKAVFEEGVLSFSSSLLQDEKKETAMKTPAISVLAGINLFFMVCEYSYCETTVYLVISR